MKKQILMLMVAINCVLLVFSQTSSPVTLTGKVMDDKNEPLPGASVRVKGTGDGVDADQNGNFRIKVKSLPVTLLVSYTNYLQMEVLVENTNDLSVQMNPLPVILEGVILGSKGLPTRIINYAGSAELIGIGKIRQLPTTSVYDATQYQKGVDLTSSSLTFKTPSTRGFNGSGSTRVNQLVDGMDNQAPGLNFFVGNFAGIPDLDFASVELLPGASSALYGPGGMNGTVLINSKNPFDKNYQGVSVMVKPGIMHLGKSGRGNSSMYNDYSFRWARNFNNRFAFKLGAQYISADDWLANDTSNYLRSGTSGKLISGNRMTDPNYDGVNVYGDETSVNMRVAANGVLAYATQQFIDGFRQIYGVDPTQTQINGFLSTNPQTQPFYLGIQNGIIPDQNVSRTGYNEKDIIDPKTKNIKLNGALHYKLNDRIEAILMGYWSTGNTVYTDDNRYALKGIKIGQYKFELKSKNWFFRTYTTQEDAGEAYSATVATQFFNEAWKPSQQWYPEYVGAYLGALGMGATPALAHLAARSYADIGRPEAGSENFKQLFDQVRKTPIPNGGLFKEKSQLWMSEGQYNFGDAVKNVGVVVGGNFKKYVLNSGGTLFIDTAGAIKINEIGAYAQLTKKLFDEKLTLVGSGRFDKNENFKAQFTPRFAALFSIAKNNNLRVSYQTAYRFPGNLAQWIRLNVGGDYLLLGGLPWVQDYMHVKENPVHLITASGPEVNPYVFKDFKPETMRSFEVGYKGVIKNKLMVDAYAYFGKYKDFIGRIGLYQPNTGEAYSITVNSDNKVRTYGFGVGLDYTLKKNFSLFFNAYSDVITDVPAGFKSYFNTPKYRLNAGIGNSGFGKEQRFSFSVMMRWQDAFQWEGELANGPLSAFATADAQVSYKIPKIKSTFRIGGTNILNHYYKNAYGNPQIGGLYYASYIYNL